MTVSMAASCSPRLLVISTPSVVEAYDACRGGRDRGAVAGDQDRGAAGGGDGQQVQHPCFGDAVQFTGGFVGEQHGRVVGQRDRQSGAGEFSAGELAGIGSGPSGEAERLSRSGRSARWARRPGNAPATGSARR